jgi:hypothetical protein
MYAHRNLHRPNIHQIFSCDQRPPRFFPRDYPGVITVPQPLTVGRASRLFSSSSV